MTDIWTLRKQVKAAFQSLKSIYCPLLSEEVYFTSDGFFHLINESNRAPRKISEQYLKLKCFTYVPDVIVNCQRINEIRTIRKKVKGKWKQAVCYELVCPVGRGEDIRVILEKIGNGKLHFLSVMPHRKRPKTKKHLK